MELYREADHYLMSYGISAGKTVQKNICFINMCLVLLLCFYSFTVMFYYVKNALCSCDIINYAYIVYWFPVSDRKCK